MRELNEHLWHRILTKPQRYSIFRFRANIVIIISYNDVFFGVFLGVCVNKSNEHRSVERRFLSLCTLNLKKYLTFRKFVG